MVDGEEKRERERAKKGAKVTEMSANTKIDRVRLD
jgi:hypothetical protein